ncbi:MAG: hypothetical protein ACRELB_06730, partial [Polyangiaceae bacterium]
PVSPEDGAFSVRIASAPVLRVTAESASGRALASWQGRLRVDLDPPRVTLDQGAEQVSRDGRFLVSGVVADANLEPVVTLDGVSYPLEDGGRFKIACAVSGAEERPVLRARDLAGNVTEVPLHLVRDADPPRIEIAAPLDGAVVTAARVVVSGRVIDATPESLTVAAARVPIGPDGAFRGFVALDEGSNRISLRARDRAGNEAEAAITVVRDDTPPSVTLDPLDPVTRAPRVTVTGALDKDGCRVVVNDVPATLTGRRFRADVPLLVGNNTIIAVAIDGAGNRSDGRAEVRRVSPEVGVIETVNERWGIVIVRLDAAAHPRVGDLLRAFRGDESVGALRVAKVMDPEPGESLGTISATPEGAELRNFAAGDHVRPVED